jgi:hypothetical protein
LENPAEGTKEWTVLLITLEEIVFYLLKIRRQAHS